MSHKVILTLAAVAVVAAATLASSIDSYAHGVRSGSGIRSHFAGASHLPRLREPNDPGRHIGLHEHHRHWAFRHGIWVEVEDVVADAVDVAPAVTPGPCTCLTKNYTPTGLVVFADICTKESASAPVDSTADATQAPTTPPPAAQAPAATETPSNFAGRTYQDFLTANPQAAVQAPAKN
ncbi:MAG TPA: hypothetical protein VMF32_12040 [Xanthobacteraceae bacterium]|nr:hypothetical protein [Xanthobacteraceae bacterium]